MQTKVRLSNDGLRYNSINLAEIQFKKPNGEYSQNRLEYLDLNMKKIHENVSNFRYLFNDIINRFDDTTDEYCYYLRGEVFFWHGFYSLYRIINDVFKKRGIQHKLKFLDNNPNLKFKENTNYVGYPYMLGIPFYEPDEVVFDNRIIDKHFLCLNRRVKPFREDIVDIIHEYKLFDKFHYSFGVDGNSSNHPFYKELDGDVPEFYNPITSFEESTFCLLITENSVENVNRTHNPTLDEVIHLRNGLINHLTEKTTRALCLGMPFIIVGQPHSLQTLQEHGFKTFGDFWNEDYDEDIHWEVRLKRIKKLILEMSHWTLEVCNKLYQQMIPILEHNRKRYLEIKKDWESNVAMENTIDYDFPNEDEYYQFFEHMKFESKSPMVNIIKESLI